MNNKKQQVIEITDTLTELMIVRDVNDLNKLLDTNFSLSHIKGYVQSKIEMKIG
jgi:hypothetical protein